MACFVHISYQLLPQVPFFTTPPENDHGGGAEGAKTAEAVFVQGFGKGFDVEAGDVEVSGISVYACTRVYVCFMSTRCPNLCFPYLVWLHSCS